MKRISTLFSFILLCFILAGCSTPWAPAPEGERKNRLKFYETDHWPYARELPPIKVPAQLAAGLPSLPAIVVMTPFTLFSSDEPTYDFGMAVIEAERLYMEYPGYAIYRAVGYPMYILKTGAVVSGEYIYGAFSSDEEEKEPGPDEGDDDNSGSKDSDNIKKQDKDVEPIKPINSTPSIMAQKGDESKTESTSTEDSSSK